MVKNNNKSNISKPKWNDLVKALPLLYLLLVFISIVKSVYYYSEFGIEIIGFLDLNEVPILFIDDIISLGISLLGVLFFWLIPEKKEIEKIEREEYQEYLKEKKFIRRFFLYWESRILDCILAIIN